MVFLSISLFLRSKYADKWQSRWMQGRSCRSMKELATKDMLTKLYNRNAYDEWIKVNRRPKKAKIVVFDLNNLKQCNDTMGHAAGDAYIQNAAGIILHVFGNCGNCYRIGGDEFCVVIYGNDPSDMEELFRQMKLRNRMSLIRKRNTTDTDCLWLCGV